MKNVLSFLLTLILMVSLVSCSSQSTATSKNTTSSQDSSISSEKTTSSQSNSTTSKNEYKVSPIWERSKEDIICSIEHKLETQSIMTGDYSLQTFDNLYCVYKDDSLTDILIGCSKTSSGNSVFVYCFDRSSFNSSSGDSSDISDETMAFALSAAIILSECNPDKYNTLDDAEDAFFDLFEEFSSRSDFNNMGVLTQLADGVQYSLAVPVNSIAFSASNPYGESPLNDIVSLLED